MLFNIFSNREQNEEEEQTMAATFLFACNFNVNHGCMNDNPLPKLFLGAGHRIRDQTLSNRNQTHQCVLTRKSSRRFSVSAVTKGSAKSSKSDEKIPLWAKPDSDEPPPWAQNEGKKDDAQEGFEVPFFVYLLASAITAIAAVSSLAWSF